MASDENALMSSDVRPGWAKVGWTTLVGVVAGAFVYLVLQWPVIFFSEALFGSSNFREGLEAWPLPLRFVMLALYWTLPVVLGQIFSAMLSGWSKAIYLAAALQTVHLLNIYFSLDLFLLWLLPAAVAFSLAGAKCAAFAARKGRSFAA